MTLTFHNSDGTKHYKVSFCYDAPFNTPDHGLWLSNEGGEGMKIKPEALFDIVDEYFKKNF